jgi:hypothetical protein
MANHPIFVWVDYELTGCNPRHRYPERLNVDKKPHAPS